MIYLLMSEAYGGLSSVCCTLLAGKGEYTVANFSSRPYKDLPPKTYFWLRVTIYTIVFDDLCHVLSILNHA